MYFVQSTLRLKKLEFHAGYEVDSMNIIETQSIEIDLVERQKINSSKVPEDLPSTI